MNCVTDACNVYWTDQATGGVMRVSKNGGTTSPVATSSPPPGQSMLSEGLAIDSSNIYWSEYVDTGPGSVPLRTGDVTQTSLIGSVSKQIWTGTDAPNAVAVDGTYVYILQNSDLERVPIGGGQVATLANGAGAYGLTVTPAAAFWTTYNGVDSVMSVPLDGGASSTFTTGTSGTGSSSTSLVQDGTNLYWGDSKSGGVNGSVYLKPIDGGTQVSLSSAAEPLGIAYDASYVYVTTGQGGTVLKIAKSGAGVTTLASGQGWPYGIAVDDNFVYWVNNNGGTNSVMRIAK